MTASFRWMSPLLKNPQEKQKIISFRKKYSTALRFLCDILSFFLRGLFFRFYKVFFMVIVTITVILMAVRLR
jgi:hypothetical protein